MFCEKCGTQIPDDNKFCTNCGAVIGQETGAAAAAPAAVAVAKKSITINKKTMIIGAAVIAVVILAIVLISWLSGRPDTIVLDDYIKVEFSGLSTKGEADLDFDLEQMVMDLAGDDQKEAAEMYYTFMDCLEIYLDKYSGLSNGDTVTICFDWVEEVFEEYNLKLKLKNDEITVEGLREPEFLDLFADLEFTYTGYAPNASVSVTYTGSHEYILNNVYFYVNGGYSLSEGSTFTVEASFSSWDAEEKGYIITETSKTYTASNVPQPTKLDLFADLKVTFEGCAPYSKAKVEYVGSNEFIRDYVYFYINNGNNLSEGSVFTVEASYSSWTAEQYGYVIEVTSKEYTASNLPQPVELDVFQYITVTFSGIEGAGEASYTVNTDDYFIKYCLNYSFNKNSGLTGGETIALMFTVDSWVDPLQYGYTIGVTSKQYTVPTLGKEATSFNDLTAEGQTAILAKLDELAKYYLTKENADNGTNKIKLHGTNYSSGNELSHASEVKNIKLHSVVTGEFGYWVYYPRMVFVYTFDVVNHPNIVDNNSCAAGACIYFYLEDPVVKADGTLEIDMEKDIHINRDCYLSYDALCEDYLNSGRNMDTYTAE